MNEILKNTSFTGLSHECNAPDDTPDPTHEEKWRTDELSKGNEDLDAGTSHKVRRRHIPFVATTTHEEP